MVIAISAFLPLAGQLLHPSTACRPALIAVLLLVLVAGAVLLGLCGSHGGLPALVAGLFPPAPRRLPRDACLIEAARPPHSIEVTVDLERPIATLPVQYLSVSIDTSQLAGGKWWNPHADGTEWRSGTVATAPFDFDRPRLQTLVQALSPAYLRLGGSEADKVFYDLAARRDPGAPLPPGFESRLTRAQWDAAHDFARRHGLEIVFTLNAGPAVRDRSGGWSGDHAADLLAYTASQGYSVAAWELGNELNVFFAVHGLRARVGVRQYCSDLAAARSLLDRHLPGSRLACQGSAFWPVLGEPLGLLFGYLPEMLRQAGSLLDLVTWHYYPQQSRRTPACSRKAHPSRLLDPANLDEAAHWAGKMAQWRDRYAPGKALWLGETGSAQTGGEPGLSDTYLAGLWWLDQLGLMATCGQEVIVRQSLTGMDYGLLDEPTLEPRPDYWNSLLWKQLMGPAVYRVAVRGGAGRVRAYAHSAPGNSAGKVTVLAINLDPTRPAEVGLPQFAACRGELYALAAPDVLGRGLWLNGTELALGSGDALPDLSGTPLTPSGRPPVLAPLSYAFVRLSRG